MGNRCISLCLFFIKSPPASPSLFVHLAYIYVWYFHSLQACTRWFSYMCITSKCSAGHRSGCLTAIRQEAGLPQENPAFIRESIFALQSDAAHRQTPLHPLPLSALPVRFIPLHTYIWAVFCCLWGFACDRGPGKQSHLVFGFIPAQILPKWTLFMFSLTSHQVLCSRHRSGVW